MARWAEQTEGFAATLIDHVPGYRGCVRPIPGLT